MNDLRDLYTIPAHILSRNEKLIQLVEECGRLENCVKLLLQTLPEEQRDLLEEFITLRDQLEWEAVKQAMRFGKRCS